MSIHNVYLREDRLPIFFEVCVEVKDTHFERFLKITLVSLAMITLLASIALMITMSIDTFK